MALYENDIFLSVANGMRQIKRVINLPKECSLERGTYHLKLWTDDAEIESTQNLQWQNGFLELYTFFKDVMNVVNAIVTTKTGRDLWNEMLKKRNLALISELGGKKNV